MVERPGWEMPSPAFHRVTLRTETFGQRKPMTRLADLLRLAAARWDRQGDQGCQEDAFCTHFGTACDPFRAGARKAAYQKSVPRGLISLKDAERQRWLYRDNGFVRLQSKEKCHG
jgi:hypothetical protein